MPTPPHTPAAAQPQHPQTGAPARRGPSLPRLDSAELFGGANEVRIAHGDAVYRLRITSLGKLILTK